MSITNFSNQTEKIYFINDVIIKCCSLLNKDKGVGFPHK